MDKQRWLTWCYANRNVPNAKFWQRSHDSIICHWKGKPVFNADSVREPYTERHIKRIGNPRPAAKSQLGSVETTYNLHDGSPARDVLQVPLLTGKSSQRETIVFCKSCNCLVQPKKRTEHESHDLLTHPTQKPLALAERLIKSCKPEGEYVVLVPFCGSGSECIATLMQGGNFIAFDINPDYARLAAANLAFYRNTRSYYV
jgi:site-specific DNA-methyltransferase (adenine-specific)